MSDYTPTGNPATDAAGVSADIRTEFGLIQTAIATKLDTTGTAAKATILETTRAIYGNNFDGSAALTQVIAGTYGGTGVNNSTRTITYAGNVAFTGAYNVSFTIPGAYTYTYPSATSTLLATNGSGASLTFSGTSTLALAGNLSTTGAYAVSFTMPGAYTYTFPGSTCTLLASGGALGTPASGNLANCTGFPGSGVTSIATTAPLSGGTITSTGTLSMAAASSGVNGYMTGTYATKLDGIAASATNVTNTNQLTNGAGFLTANVTTYGAIGTYTIACITAMSTDTAYAVNTTYAGSALYGSNYADVSTLGSLNGNNVSVTVATSASLSLSGTWQLMTRMYRGSNHSTAIPIGLFVRIS